MKCVILGAGLGSRLQPFSQELPKPMMPVVNKPLLEHTIQTIRNIGIQDILINLFYLPETIKSYFGDGSNYGVHITWGHETKLSGPAGALLTFEEILCQEQVVLVVSGDALHDVNLDDFVQTHKKSGAQLSVVMKEVQDAGRFGVGSVGQDNLLTDFVEKPPLPHEDYGLVSCGIYCITLLYSLCSGVLMYMISARI
ncbi:nucleotidyltransferase family protein [Dictyobacter kobayashii]|uniref:Nucleotidyl transferase domain-containing protein n=1 Tax=Dictyobacter kobayashii TaxID=2014872 RepID=A0A402AC93_9CHLR|nr:nucleotidyltransferase family protein [Dictyobacter kobayashii]GCE16709.1 hypothetical protein KDK_05090 [Dictyobacter kobayashii]